MNLEEIYYISQIIAVIAIIGSLVAIYFQQVQTNKIARAQISQGLSGNYQGSMRELITPELALIFRKVMFEPSPLSPVEATQILVYFNLAASSFQDAFHAERDGLVDNRLLQQFSHNFCWYLTAPVFMAEWRRTERVGLYGPGFVAYVNGRFAKLHPDREASRTAPVTAEPHA